MATRPDNTAQVLEAYLRDAMATRPQNVATAGWKFQTRSAALIFPFLGLSSFCVIFPALLHSMSLAGP